MTQSLRQTQSCPLFGLLEALAVFAHALGGAADGYVLPGLAVVLGAVVEGDPALGLAAQLEPSQQAGSWRRQLMLPARGLFALPDADPQQLAMIGSNPPTAVLALGEYTEVPAGSWVVQNAANSGVGRSLIAIAHSRGIRTLNFARNEASFDALRAAGADLVLPDAPESVAIAKQAVGDAAVPLAIDGVGGASTENLISMLTARGVLVTYAAESGSPLSVPYFALGSKHLTVRGFFAGEWDFESKMVPAIREAATLIAAGKLTVPVSGVYGLDRISEVLDHLDRGGKVLLDLRNG
jgi:NADPH:quinone reductase-like Zn-dependent oxidoreductase